MPATNDQLTLTPNPEQQAKEDKRSVQARLNGSKSKGPTSAAGKQTSSLNSIRHGLCANENTLLESEVPAEYNEVRDAFIADLRPATKAELRLVEKIANLDWRIERLTMMETSLFNIAACVSVQDIERRFDEINGIGIIALSWTKAKSTTECFDLLRRYQTSLQHQFNTTLGNFRNFEKRRLTQVEQDSKATPYTEPAFDTIVKSELEQPEPVVLPNEPTPVSKITEISSSHRLKEVPAPANRLHLRDKNEKKEQ